MGLHRPNRFLSIGPGSRGVADRANVGALLFGRARDPSAASLCASPHASERPSRRSCAGHAATGTNKASSVAARNGYPRLAFHDYAPSYVNTVRREAREATTADIEQISSILVATTDPTARRQLVELDRELARLTAEQREVLLLVGLEGMDYDSVAQILGVPLGTVRSRLSRGRERLRELMGRDKEPQQTGHSPDTEAPTTRPNTAVSLPKAA